jgi:integrase
MFATEFQRGYRDYLKGVLDYDRSFDSFTFNGEVFANLTGSSAPTSEGPVTPLIEMAKRDLDEGELGRQWGPKTIGERREQFALLSEILGADISATSVTPAKARRVKEIVMRYPKNRNKDARTRGLDLKAALAVEGVDTIGVRTMNVYLHAYGALFKWGKRNGYVQENVFAEMTVRGSKRLGGRDAFSPDTCSAILMELLHNKRGLIRKDYQKWGPLIGLYTGARLGEITQLRIADIRQQDGIWCFDLNEDDGKKLKTDGSKRLVPMHSKLMEHGFLDYVQQHKHEKLFPEFTYCPKNGWGRNFQPRL